MKVLPILCIFLVTSNHCSSRSIRSTDDNTSVATVDVTGSGDPAGYTGSVEPADDTDNAALADDSGDVDKGKNLL